MTSHRVLTMLSKTYRELIGCGVIIGYFVSNCLRESQVIEVQSKMRQTKLAFLFLSAVVILFMFQNCDSRRADSQARAFGLLNSQLLPASFFSNDAAPPNPFVEIQRIPTVGASDWEHFQIGADHYLVVANFNASSSQIYKFSGTGFVPFQSIITQYANDWEAFQIGGITYLAVANYMDGQFFEIQSKLYKWTGSMFEEFQSIPTTGAFEFTYFSIGSDHFLAIANEHSFKKDANGNYIRIVNAYGDLVYVHDYAQQSELYRWNGVRFELFQQFSTDAAHHLEHFQIGSDHFIAVANYYSNPIYDAGGGDLAYEPVSKIYKWHSSTVKFAEFQTLPTKGAFDLEFFTIDGSHFLAAANSISAANNLSFDLNSNIFRWDGAKFVIFQDVFTHDAVDVHFFQFGSSKYLAFANAFTGDRETSSSETNSEILKWNGSSFSSVLNVPTFGAYGWENFVMNGFNFLIVANSIRRGSSSVESVIYQLAEIPIPASYIPVEIKGPSHNAVLTSFNVESIWGYCDSLGSPVTITLAYKQVVEECLGNKFVLNLIEHTGANGNIGLRAQQTHPDGRSSHQEINLRFNVP